MAPSRLAIVVFDAAESTLVQHAIDEGRMPALAGILAGGGALRLAPPSAFPGSAWPTLITGHDVHEHRLVSNRALVPGSYRIVHVRAAALARPPFWRAVSDAGLRSTVVSVYGAPLLQRFRGTQVLGWGTNDPFTTPFGEPLVDPPAARAWLRRSGTERRPADRLSAAPTVRAVRRYRDAALRGVTAQAESLALLASHTDWSFFLGTFAEPHPAGHLLWHLADTEHGRHDPSLPVDVRAALGSIYEAVDAGIGRLREVAGRDARFVVLTPHGMGPWDLPDDPADAVLSAAGLLRRAAPVAAPGAAARARAALRHLWRLAHRTVPWRLKELAGRGLRRDGLLSSLPLADVDWTATRAFALPGDLGSFVRVNLAGREPLGTVRPGRDYEALCDELVALFTGLVDARTGEPAAARVLRTADVLGAVPGPLPDVTVTWNASRGLHAVRSPTTGTIELERVDSRTGQHRPHGFLVDADARGPAAGLDGAPLASLLDVAPTVLQVLGVPVPPEYSGDPITALTSVGAAGRARAGGAPDA